MRFVQATTTVPAVFLLATPTLRQALQHTLCHLLRLSLLALAVVVDAITREELRVRFYQFV